MSAPLRCIRWGNDSDRCVHTFDHTGPCQDAEGNSTRTLAEEYLRAAVAADTHSSDVEPMVEEWFK